jgi:hypothetical protein
VVVNGDMQITNGTFTAPGSGKTFRVTGNWTNSGTFTHNNTPVEFSGTGTQTIDDNSGAFYGITHTGAGTLKLDDSVTINGDFSNTSGTFDLNGKTVTVKGSFTNSGAFNGTGTVTFDDATQVSYIHGTTFENLTVNTPGKELVFDAGATETITGTLTLTGAAGSLITLRSSVTGSQWNIDPQGTVNVSYVDVKDSKNLNSRIISPANSVNSGNNTNWFPAASTISTGAGDNVIYREQAMPRPIFLSSYLTIMPSAIFIPETGAMPIGVIIPVLVIPQVQQPASLDYTQQTAQVALNKGIGNFNSANYDEAINDFTKAITLTPDLAQAYYYRAVAYYSTLEYDKALADVHEAESLGYKVDPIFLKELNKFSEGKSRP